MNTRRTFVHLTALGLVCATGAARLPSARADEPAPRVLTHLHASGDFIDDPIALSEDGTRMAWITTDGATRAVLHVGAVGDDKNAKTFPYGSITAERVVFLDNDRVLVSDRDPSTRLAKGEVFGPKGSMIKIPAATDIAVGVAAGVPAITSWLKTDSPEGAKHTFNAWRRDNLKPIGKKVLVENREGRVAFAGSLYKPLYFLDGFGTLVGQKEGAYDKKKDIRRPELAAKADLFAGKLLEEKEIKDVVAFADFTGNLRKSHNNETHFAAFWPDRQVFSHVNAELFPTEAVAPITLPRPLGKYDPATLLYRPNPDGNLTVSLTIDPVNPEAVRAQKADKDWIDFYVLDTKARSVTPLLRVEGLGRPSTWWRAGNRVALLRKHKGFGRGGSDLDVLEFGEAKPAPAVATPAPAPAPTAPTDDKAEPAGGGGKGEKKAPAKTR